MKYLLAMVAILAFAVGGKKLAQMEALHFLLMGSEGLPGFALRQSFIRRCHIRDSLIPSGGKINSPAQRC